MSVSYLSLILNVYNGGTTIRTASDISNIEYFTHDNIFDYKYTQSSSNNNDKNNI